ncbi:MAG: hypothetical protein ACI8WY_001994, partial [Planctomycetota bacterium]
PRRRGREGEPRAGPHEPLARGTRYGPGVLANAWDGLG